MANRYHLDTLCNVTTLPHGATVTFMVYVDDDVTGLPVAGQHITLRINGGNFASGDTFTDGYLRFGVSEIVAASYLVQMVVGSTVVGNSVTITWTAAAFFDPYTPHTTLQVSKGDTIAALDWTAAPTCDPRGVLEGYDVLRTLADPGPVTLPGGYFPSGFDTPAHVIATNLNQLSYLNTGLNNATDYWYGIVPRWRLPGVFGAGTGNPIRGVSNIAKLLGRKETWGTIRVNAL